MTNYPLMTLLLACFFPWRRIWGQRGEKKEKDAPPLYFLFFLKEKNENFNSWCNVHVNQSKTTYHVNGSISLPRRVRLAKQRTRLWRQQNILL
jgi:hypothetical protein